MINIKNNFSTDIAKKIFGNINNVKNFLIRFNGKKDIGLPYRKINKGKNNGKDIIDIADKDLYKYVIKNWDYDTAIKIIREMFILTNKYKSGKDSHNVMNILFQEWNKLNLGNIEWPFSQGAFDNFVQSINSEDSKGVIKDEKVKIAAVKYRRIKEINTVRNDFIETLIFEKNKNILPTLNHNRGVDFYIDGVSFDQKVSRSPTNEFKKKYGENWKDFAIKNPDIVAEYLYKYQDEGRFGADSRLLVVYLDEDISVERISQIINKTNLDNPIEITFDYTHNSKKPTENVKTYKVKCFVVLLYN